MNVIESYRAFTGHSLALKLVPERAEGVFIYDETGRPYLDFSTGYGVVNIGYSHPEMLEVMREKAEKLTFIPPWIPTRESAELAEFLLRALNLQGFQCVRATGGAEANETAFRLAHCRKPGKILSFWQSFHGGTRATIKAGDSRKIYFARELPGSLKINPPLDTGENSRKQVIADLEQILREENVSAILLEPVLASGGVYEFTAALLADIRRICDRHEITLIFDEVVTGMGRTGWFCHSLKTGVVPDVYTFAKGFSSGYAAIGAVVAKKELVSRMNRDYYDVTSTFSWMPLAASLAMKNMEIILRDDLGQNARNKGETLANGVRDIFSRYFPEKLKEVRNAGLMIGIQLVEEKATQKPAIKLGRKLLIACKDEALLLATAWSSNILMLLPPLILTEQELKLGLHKLEAAARKVSKCL